MIFKTDENGKPDINFAYGDIMDFLCIVIQKYKRVVAEQGICVNVDDIARNALRYFCNGTEMDYKDLVSVFDRGSYNELPYFVKITIADVINRG